MRAFLSPEPFLSRPYAMAAAVGLGQTHVCSRHGSMRTPTPYSGPWFGRGMNKTKVDLRVERLVDDAKHVHSRDGARILGCLALRVVEVRGNRHHGIVELGAEVGLRSPSSSGAPWRSPPGGTSSPLDITTLERRPADAAIGDLPLANRHPEEMRKEYFQMKLLCPSIRKNPSG